MTSYVQFTIWFVAHDDDANVLPPKIVPALLLANSPMLAMFFVAVTNEFALSNVPVNLIVFDVLEEAAVTAARFDTSPSRFVPAAATIVPVPSAMYPIWLLPALAASAWHRKLRYPRFVI
jgi:hypothetical protein